jgi:hypothetical protein
MTSPLSWIIAVFLLFGSFSVDSFCLRGDMDLVTREDVELLVRQEDSINVAVARAIRVSRRNPGLSHSAMATANVPFPQVFTSGEHRFTSAAKIRQLHLSTVLRV